MVKYAFAETKSDLAQIIADRLIETASEGDRNFGVIDFKVEDTPTAQEAAELSVEELVSRYDTAAGAYGVREIHTEFDQEGIQLAFGYYGGTEGIVVDYYDDNYEIDRADAEERIEHKLNEVLNLELARLRRNFLVKIVY